MQTQCDTGNNGGNLGGDTNQGGSSSVGNQNEPATQVFSCFYIFSYFV